MRKIRLSSTSRLLIALISLLTVALVASAPVASQDGAKVSRLGEYKGYSSPIYKDWARTSQYITVRDGTRIAIDIVRPLVNGRPAEEKLPVLLMHTRYHRARIQNGVPFTRPDYYELWGDWLQYGYVIAISDIRGGGASFGTRTSEFMDADATDAYDVIEWLAKQPWSNGKVGMFGVSYDAITQFMAAGAAPPSLKAIIPQMALFDLYSFVYPGGIFHYEFLQSWGGSTALLDKVLPPVVVDEDKDGALARAAVAEHQANVNVYAATSTVPFRDSIYAPLNKQTYFAWNLTRFAEGINKSGVALYQFAGWYDMYPRDQAAWFNNLTIPQRILFTPFSHAIGTDSGWKQFISKMVNDDFTTEELHRYHITEHLRFWDYYLKGIDNGIMKEPPVWYYVMGAPAGQAWRSSDRWPLGNEVRTKYYLQGGPSGSIASVNDGLLSAAKPTAAGKDDYKVDYTTTSGKETRWHDGHGGRFFYPNMSEQGKKSLTYTTIPLKEPVEITGHPVMHLWMTASSEDADVFAYIEEVDETGYTYYVTEGMLRASHRALSEPPFKYMGLPYHRSFKEDIKSLPKGERVELVFELLPTSNIFDAGHRIRVRIVGADTDSFTTPRQDPAPVISVYRDTSNASFIELPIIPTGK